MAPPVTQPLYTAFFQSDLPLCCKWKTEDTDDDDLCVRTVETKLNWSQEKMPGNSEGITKSQL